MCLAGLPFTTRWASGLLVPVSMRLATVLGSVVALGGCLVGSAGVSREDVVPTSVVSVSEPAAPPDPSHEPGEPPLSPLEAPGPFLDLPVPHHRDAVVSLPLGATTPRPVLLAAHGAGDRPEWQCQVWRGIVGDRAFILCPRGFPMNPYLPPGETGYFYTTHHALGREITLALEALRARFPEHLDAEAPAFAGFSQGAIMGALLLPNHPARFTRAALVEGGFGLFHEWNIPVAQRWQRHGGVRALLACGRPECVDQAQVTAGYLRRGGVEARVVHAEGAGHSYGGVMEEDLRRTFAWVIEGDSRW